MMCVCVLSQIAVRSIFHSMHRTYCVHLFGVGLFERGNVNYSHSEFGMRKRVPKLTHTESEYHFSTAIPAKLRNIAVDAFTIDCRQRFKWI